MKESIKNILLWIGVFPGAILGAFLSTFPLHWLLYGTLKNGSTISGVNIEPIEFFLYPFVMALVFIVAGSYIAPKYKMITAIVLSFIYLSFFVFSFLFSSDMVFGSRSVGALMGLFLGLFIVWKNNNKIIKESK